MKVTSIVYTSNTGYTKQYAEILGEKIGLPVYSLDESVSVLKKGSSVIYLGWLMAGKIKGYSKAVKRYKVEAVCPVGMSSSDSQTQSLKKSNDLPENLPVFMLQGGFDITKLRGIYKLMMKVMINTVGKGLAEKNDRTSEEDEMLDLMINGGTRVDEKNLEKVISWHENYKGSL